MTINHGVIVRYLLHCCVHAGGTHIGWSSATCLCVYVIQTSDQALLWLCVRARVCGVAGFLTKCYKPYKDQFC